MFTQKQQASRFRPSIFLSLIAFLLVYTNDPSSHASFLDDVIGGAGDVLETAGGLLGRPFGGFLGSATGPTVQNFEDAGHRLISDVDSRLAGRVDQLGAEIQKNITSADAVLERRLIQLDGIAAERLSQVDSILQKNVKLADDAMAQNIKRLDDSAQARITQVDTMLADRIGQLDGVLDDSLDRVDGILAERLSQFDEIAEARIGNVDVVAAKATLNLESSLLRLVGASCVVIFFAAAVWSTYKFGYLEWRQIPKDIIGWRTRQHPRKTSQIMKRRMAGWSCDFMMQVLTGKVT